MLTVPALLLTATSPLRAAQVDTKIQPGAAIVTESGSQCTLNWIYDGRGVLKGQVFAGTAAHCVSEKGETVSLQTGTFGSATTEIGKVAFISEGYDYSLIRISKEKLALVDPAMKGHPQIPTGVTTVETAALGDIIQFSGNGTGFHATQETREKRQGLLHTIQKDWWSAAGPVTQGDSGGPSGNVTDGNKALGVVDVLCAGIDCTGAGGVTVEAILAETASLGMRLKLRTV